MVWEESKDYSDYARRIDVQGEKLFDGSGGTC